MRLPCPQCGQLLEAPEPLPSSAQCPFCAAVFVPGAAPAPLAAAAPQFRRLARDKVLAPAISLLLTGALWTALASLQLGNLIVSFGKPQPMPALPFFVNMNPQDWDRSKELSERVGVVLLPVSLIMGVLVIWGAIRMMQLRSYSLALTACILPMIPCTCNCCWVIGLPFGVWGLIVLTKPLVRSAFE